MYVCICLCVCMYVYVYVYIYVHVYVSVYVYTHTHTHINAPCWDGSMVTTPSASFVNRIWIAFSRPGGNNPCPSCTRRAPLLASITCPCCLAMYVTSTSSFGPGRCQFPCTCISAKSEWSSSHYLSGFFSGSVCYVWHDKWTHVSCAHMCAFCLCASPLLRGDCLQP